MVERQSRAQIAEQDAHERKMLAQIFSWRAQIVFPVITLALSVAAAFVAAVMHALWR